MRYGRSSRYSRQPPGTTPSTPTELSTPATPTGFAESVAAYNDFLQAGTDEVPYILFGHLIGCVWTQGDIAYNSVGQNSYYWNNYFAD